VILQELKNQQRDLDRKIRNERIIEVEKALRDFMELILDDRMPLEIKQTTMIESYKATMVSIFND
jgi:hypothetical protein